MATLTTSKWPFARLTLDTALYFSLQMRLTKLQIASNCGWPEILDELNAARKRVQVMKADRAAEDEMKVSKSW